MSSRDETAASALRAGAAETTITPAPGVDLSGYAAREGPSIDVHDDLWCRAVVLDDGMTRVALISLDLLGIDFELDAAIRAAVARSARIDPQGILVNCSHTHAGPAVVNLTGLGLPDPNYVEKLPAWIAETVDRACARLEPAEAGYGEAPVSVGINRRERTTDGATIIGRNPEGVRDDQVRVLSITHPTGEPIALLFSHAAHGTTLGGANRAVSSEWMGDACRRLRDRLGGDAVAVFLQGCCGEISPDHAGTSFAEVERLGGIMADAVAAAQASSRPVSLAGIGTRLERVGLSLQDPPAAEAARADLEKRRQELERARAGSASAYWARALEGQVEYSQWVLGLSERGEKEMKLPFAVQALALGEVALVGLSGEVFFELAREIEAASPFPHTMVLGYANGCTGYVPTAKAVAEGGYEADDSFRWYGTLRLAPGAGGEMVASAVRMLETLG